MAEITKEIWSDLHQSLTSDAQGNLRKSVNVEAVRTSIDNILGTSPGERVFLPSFALGLHDLVFEPIDRNMANRMSNNIKERIEFWDPRVEVVGVNFKEDSDNNYVELAVNFRIKSYTEVFNYSTVITQ